MDKLGREYTAFVPVRQHRARPGGVGNPSPVSHTSAGWRLVRGRKHGRLAFLLLTNLIDEQTHGELAAD